MVCGKQFIFLVGCEETYPRSDAIIVYMDFITICLQRVWVHLGVILLHSEVIVIDIHMTDIHGTAFLLCHYASSFYFGAFRQDKGVALVEKVRDELIFDIGLGVDEDILKFTSGHQHLVAYQIDFLAFTVHALSQQFHRALRHFEIMAFYRIDAAGTRREQIVGCFVNGSHSYTVFCYDIMHHTDEQVCIAAHMGAFGGGGDALGSLEGVAVLPVVIVGGHEGETKVVGTLNGHIIVAKDITSSNTGPETSEHIHSSRATANGEVGTQLCFHVLSKAVAEFAAALYIGTGAGSWRVAQDIYKHGRTFCHHASPLALGFRRHYVAADRAAVHRQHVVMGAIVKQCHGQCLQRHVLFLGEGQVLRRKAVDALTQRVQFHDLRFVGANKGIVDAHLAACQLHDVWSSLLRIVVLVVFLHCRKLHDNRTSCHIDRVSETVALLGIPQFDGDLFARIVLVGVGLDAHVRLAHHVELGDVECWLRMVDA